MRKMMCLLVVSMLFLGCVPEEKVSTVADSLGVSANTIGCTWDATGWTPLPRCSYYH